MDNYDNEREDGNKRIRKLKIAQILRNMKR
jgi:hypothetical protein